MSQLSDFQRHVIVLFKTENPTWGPVKCRQILPNFFRNITERQFYAVTSRLQQDGEEAASTRKSGTGRTTKINSPTRRLVVDMAVTPPGSPTSERKRHLSQREISKELQISLGSVNKVLKDSNLKCYRRIKTNCLTQAHREAREEKCQALRERFQQNNGWKNLWFSDEATFGLHSPLNSQNERIYRAVEVKTEIEDEDLLVESDRQQPSIMVYGAVSFYGKTELRFIEGYAPGQHDLPVSRRRKKTVTKEVYTEEMLPAMFSDISGIMDGRPWCWQQDGAKAHTANQSVEWLQRNAPDFITPIQWPAKSPDLNVLDYCIWSILLDGTQRSRQEIRSIDDLKNVLTTTWNSISQETLQNATKSWIKRLNQCIQARGSHFEHF